MVKEVQENETIYQSFFTHSDFENEVALYETEYSGTILSNALPIALSNVLSMQIVVLCDLQSFPIIPITPRTCDNYTQPMWLVYCGGFYKCAFIKDLPSTSEAVKSKKCSCRTGCNSYQSRCPCFRSPKGCTSSCDCQNCQNMHGSRPASQQKRVRRKHSLTTKWVPDQSFTVKNGENPIIGWSAFETYLLHELINHLADQPAAVCDANTIHELFSQLVLKCSFKLNQKDVNHVRKKMKELKTNDDAFQTVVRSQLNVL